MRNELNRLTEIEVHAAVARNACSGETRAAASAIKCVDKMTEADALVLLHAVWTGAMLGSNLRLDPLTTALESVMHRLQASIAAHEAAQAVAACKAQQQEWNSLAVREQGGLAQFERAFADTELAK